MYICTYIVGERREYATRLHKVRPLTRSYLVDELGVYICTYSGAIYGNLQVQGNKHGFVGCAGMDVLATNQTIQSTSKVYTYCTYFYIQQLSTSTFLTGPETRLFQSFGGAETEPGKFARIDSGRPLRNANSVTYLLPKYHTVQSDPKQNIYLKRIQSKLARELWYVKQDHSIRFM